MEIIPTVVTYWRYEQLLWKRLATAAPERLRGLQRLATLIAAGSTLAIAALVSRLYVTVPSAVFSLALSAGALALLAGTAAYLMRRPPARRLIWP